MIPFEKNTPEERVRQSVLDWLVCSGGYSRHQISVEKSCRSNSSSSSSFSHSSRRLDIAIYLKDPQGILRIGAVIECKAGNLQHESLQQTQRQVLGYRWHSHPLMVAIACENGSWHCYEDKASVWLKGIPIKAELVAKF
jgi:hypothetical protein